MRKKELSDDKFDKVRELREAGYSWLQIQKKTGVERRIAKRVYNEWLHGRTLNELKQARVNVATEAFSEHIDHLIKLAVRLTDLGAPTSSIETRRADDVLRQLLEMSILGEVYESSQADSKRKIQRNYRQNTRLLESLQDHTHEKVRWQALDEWKKAWDSCCYLGLFNKLTIEGQKMVTDNLNRENDLLQMIKERSQQEQAVKRMAQTGLDTILQSIFDGKFDPECPEVTVTYKLVDRVVSIFTEEEWIERVRVACQNVVETLLKGDLVRQLYDEIYTIKNVIEELEEILDPLILRPMILLTPRCKLCPA